MRVHGGENLTGIRAEGTPLQTGEYAEHKQPCENTSYHRRGCLSRSGRDSSNKSERDTTPHLIKRIVSG
jgi:hypothetical protein